jgi:hypothetical protein
VSSIETIARLAHEVNRIYCESLGDTSQLPWDEAPEWQQRSVRSGVIHLLTHKDATPEDSHANWLKDKEAEGWSYGPVKNELFKTHPCLVPYAELPEQQRYKDALFHTIVRSLA